jgi:hypothetical protein
MDKESLSEDSKTTRGAQNHCLQHALLWKGGATNHLCCKIYSKRTDSSIIAITLLSLPRNLTTALRSQTSGETNLLRHLFPFQTASLANLQVTKTLASWLPQNSECTMFGH